MLIPVQKAVKSAEKWAEDRYRLEFLRTCYICYKPIKSSDDVELVYTKRKDWFMFHRECFYQEVKENAVLQKL